MSVYLRFVPAGDGFEACWLPCAADHPDAVEFVPANPDSLKSTDNPTET